MLVVPHLLDGPIAEAPGALVVGQHSLFLAALARLLSGPPVNARVEVTTRSDEAFSRVDKNAYELLLCDLRSRPVAGPELATRLARLNGHTRVVLLADPEEASLLVSSLECGAVGFFTKDASPEEFLEGVLAVCAGHYAVGRNLAKLVLARFAGHQPLSGGGDYLRLSPAEQHIIAMVGQGQSTRAIAEARSISQKTVRNHLANIYRKLQLKNRSEAILWSARMRRASAQLD
jgi:two-component system, NarL family, response regulator DegU